MNDLHPAEYCDRGERAYLAQLQPVKCITVSASAVTPGPRPGVTAPGNRVPALASIGQSSKGAHHA